MTQDKAPEWAMKEGQRLANEVGAGLSIGAGSAIALALSQAYERGQESMRERAAAECARLLVSADTTSGADDHIAKAIRSLPIEQEGGE